MLLYEHKRSKRPCWWGINQGQIRGRQATAVAVLDVFFRNQNRKSKCTNILSNLYKYFRQNFALEQGLTSFQRCKFDRSASGGTLRQRRPGALFHGHYHQSLGILSIHASPDPAPSASSDHPAPDPLPREKNRNPQFLTLPSLSLLAHSPLLPSVECEKFRMKGKVK